MCLSRKKKTSNVSSGITAGDLNMLEFSAVFVEAGDLTDVELILPGLAKGLHLGHAWGRSLKAITSVNQGQAGRLVRARWRKDKAQARAVSPRPLMMRCRPWSNVGSLTL